MFAANCRDPKMIQVYKDGKDLYSEVASMVYGVPYNEAKEFRKVLVETNKSEIDLESEVGEFELFVTDVVVTDNGNIPAIELTSGDMITILGHKLSVDRVFKDDPTIKVYINEL